MKLYKISQILGKLPLFSTYTIYLALRTFLVFLFSLSAALLILYLFPMLTDSPHIFLLLISGYGSMIFGFWGGFLFLMRKE